MMRNPVLAFATALVLISGVAWAHEPSPMEAVHVTYLDLTANFTNLQGAMDAWIAGDAAQIELAQELLERVQVLLPHVSWPDSLEGDIEQLTVALEPVTAALEAQDPAAAQQALDTAQEAMHELAHSFYEWVAETRPRE